MYRLGVEFKRQSFTLYLCTHINLTQFIFLFVLQFCIIAVVLFTMQKLFWKKVIAFVFLSKSFFFKREKNGKMETVDFGKVPILAFIQFDLLYVCISSQNSPRSLCYGRLFIMILFGITISFFNNTNFEFLLVLKKIIFKIFTVNLYPFL